MSTFQQISRVVVRGLSSCVFVVLMVASASAYTIVMRGGRHLEIPAEFLVTASTLTYEVSPGIQVTLQISAIDVAATEKANHENAGSLMRRIRPETDNAINHFGPGTTPRARKTITNQDLAVAASRRLASEEAYNRRMKELGLPPLAVGRQQAEAAAVASQQSLHERLAVEKQSEEYWRRRAGELRTEMSELDAELSYLNMKLDEVPYAGWGNSFTSVTGLAPFISFGNAGAGNRFGFRNQQRATVYSAPIGIGPQISGAGRGFTRGPVFGAPGRIAHRGVGAGAVFSNSGRLSLGARVGILPNATIFGTSPAYDYSYERSALITRFNDLAAARAGLNARWRELEEEARRAGVSPGWLRR